MKLSNETRDVLKNFAAINSNIVFNGGNEIKTVATAKNILAFTDVAETFPSESIGIYDLNEFIGVLSLVDTPRLKFDDEYVTIGDSTGRSKVKYFFSAEETLTTPSKDITMPAADVKFVLTNDTLAKLKRAASALGHSEVSITNSGGSLGLSVVDSQNSTSNAFSIDVDGEFAADSVFNFVLNIGNLKILPGDYDVEISSKLITQFSHKEMNVQYWIALEKTSTYGV